MTLDLLDFCDSENRNHIVETEKQLLETGLSTEFKEDLNMAIGEDDSEDEHDEERNVDDNEDLEQNIDDSEDSEEDVDDNEDSEQNMDDSEDSEQDIGNESILSDKDSELDGNENMSSEKTNRINMNLKSHSTNDDEIGNEESRYSDASEQSDDSKGLWEDIYGRQRDREGNVITKKYVPPAARVTNTDISIDSEKTRRLERQLKGILNRLAEQNMHTIANQVTILFDCI